jgi:SpoVK/Ycf46/Vps4 family AAA+-type ATPase
MVVKALHRGSFDTLLAELRRVTALVAQQVQFFRTGDNDQDEFRGLYVSDEEIDQLLADPQLFLAGNYPLDLTQNPENLGKTRLGYLQTAFDLTTFELDVILIALAPELDLRYEKLFAYLQDDVTRRRPTVDLALRILSPGLAAQVAARRCFDPDAPLLRYRLIEITEESPTKSISLLSRSIKLDETLVGYLLGEQKLDPRLRLFADFDQKGATHLAVEDAHLAPSTLPVEVLENIERLVEIASENRGGFLCTLHGPDETGRRILAQEVCRRLNIPLIVIDASALQGVPKLDGLLRLLARDTALNGAALYWHSYENLLKEESPTAQEALRAVSTILKEERGFCFLSSTVPIPPLRMGSNRPEFVIKLDLLTYSERQRFWEMQLGAEAIGLDLEGLSSRFRLTSGQIVAAVNTARALAAWRGETTPALLDLEEACRRHSNHRLSSLARKIVPNYRWGDIVLPQDQQNMLREICDNVRLRSVVLDKWGFDKKLSLGKGMNVILAGPSGTGKTMSAEIIASELSLDLFKIDLSTMVSKYIGETEKNLDRIFNEAGESNAILFFDEADAIFGKRSEVKDAHDRYANIETGYLLQKMEEYDGIVILATNLRKNIDEAFLRRMHFVIEYPFPDEDDRYEIWRRAFPKPVPMGDSVDLRFMAKQFKVAGGNIKNIALASAFLAAGEGANAQVEMWHLIWATRREFQKLGKLCTESDFGPYFGWLKEPDARRISIVQAF